LEENLGALFLFGGELNLVHDGALCEEAGDSLADESADVRIRKIRPLSSCSPLCPKKKCFS
jgi:hypothetical protein